MCVSVVTKGKLELQVAFSHHELIMVRGFVTGQMLRIFFCYENFSTFELCIAQPLTIRVSQRSSKPGAQPMVQ